MSPTSALLIGQRLADRAAQMAPFVVTGLVYLGVLCAVFVV